MTEPERQKILRFYAEQDADGLTNLKKAQMRAQVIRRVAETDRNKSYELSDAPVEPSEYPIGMVVEDGRLIGLGIHIFNADVYPLKSFEIYLRNCGLSGHLDLSESKDLIFVDLYHNAVESVELGELPALWILGLQDNQIASLDPGGLVACRGIDAGKNRLRTIDVSHNQELVELYVNDNALSEIDLSANKKLKYFYCHNNRLRSLDTTGNPLLRHLNATGNPLKEIRALAPQREEALPLSLLAQGAGFVGLKFNPVYNAQWKETGEWQQSYYAYPGSGQRFAGWYEADVKVSEEICWADVYGTSRCLTAVFEEDENDEQAG